MSKRHYCANCAYPQSVCVCSAVSTQECDYQVIILQHPSEVKQAKNTVRLLQLCIKNVQVHIGESPQDFSALRLQLRDRTRVAIIYPGEQSLSLENNLPEWQQASFDTLILIDSTWRKAYKIWQLNPWLQQLSGWQFSSPPPSRYQIRKANVAHSLSTLEALAYCLELTRGTNCSALYQVFEKMQQNQLKFR